MVYLKNKRSITLSLILPFLMTGIIHPDVTHIILGANRPGLFEQWSKKRHKAAKKRRADKKRKAAKKRAAAAKKAACKRRK